MDDKIGRRKKTEERTQRRKPPQRLRQTKTYGRNIWKFLQNQKKSLFTSFMLLLIVTLLFGIFSQLQPPPTSAPPSGMTVIDYSTFVKQVNAGNMLAVAIRGDEIDGLLANSPATRPASGSQLQPTATPSSKDAAADYALWSRYIGIGNSSWTGSTGTPPLNPARVLYTHLPAGGDASLMTLLLNKHVTINTLPPSQVAGWLALVWRFLPIVLLMVFLLIFLASRNSTRSTRTMDDRITQVGRSRARRFERAREVSSSQPDARKAALEPKRSSSLGSTHHGNASKLNTDPPVTFADVAGIDEVRAELEEIVQFLRTPERFSRLGARIPCGALLVGPPGTGKTLLARAVAGEADVPFFSMSASEFVEMFVGVGASRVRDLFNKARQSAPCVVFIDEIDAVGRKRSMRVAGNDERDQTLNQLLVELDGFDTRRAVVVLAATNRADILDAALLRPGRFDRRITVSLPDRTGREAILKIHARNTPLDEDVSLLRLARISTGMSGADLANLVNEAALIAARRDLRKVNHECFEEALARVQLGALRPLVMSERERRIIAYHEGGHALVAYHLAEADSVNRVTILPRGQSLGVTQFTVEEDRYNYSREMLMARIAVGLGGRVAEELIFGPKQITTGAENDLQVVTNLARRMVMRWGMSEQVGVVCVDYRAEEGHGLNMQQTDPSTLPTQTRSLVADADGRLRLNGVLPTRQYDMAMTTPAPVTSGIMMNALVDVEVQRILNDGRAMARKLLSEHCDQLELLANALIEHEQLDRSQFEALFKDA